MKSVEFALTAVVLFAGASDAIGGITSADQTHLSRFSVIATRALDSELRDFSHAHLRNVRGGVYPFGKTTKHGYLICGEINAPNRFGGYSGWRKFAISGGTPEQYTEPTLTFDDNLDALFVDQVCRRNEERAIWVPLNLK